jgi:hypothetical protein
LRGIPPRPRALSLLPISSYGAQRNLCSSPFDFSLNLVHRWNGSRRHPLTGTHVP